MTSRQFEQVLVVGLGKVGSLVGTLLHETGYQVTGLDMRPRDGLPFACDTGSIDDTASLTATMKKVGAVVSCLPYDANLKVATAAHASGIHYFDLTEDVPTTNAIREMAAKSSSLMAPQCGLAPGFIGIVGTHLASKFTKLRDIELRVGALPRHPSGLLGYAFNWSPEGVVNEYLNDCEVIKNGQRRMMPPMQEIETIVIDGVTLEAFSTSGGLGTMCETFDGKVDLLNYKTMRYPGHCRLMRFFFNELLMKNNRELAGQILVEAKPPVNDDVVYVHAAVEGWVDEKIWREEFVRAYHPKTIAGHDWRAISWTTAASVVAVVEMAATGAVPSQGFLRQEDIPLAAFLATPTGSYYDESHN